MWVIKNFVQLDDLVSYSVNKFHQHLIKSNLMCVIQFSSSVCVKFIFKKMFAEFELMSLLYENITIMQLVKFQKRYG